jgi:hypothetical protein
MGQARTLVPMLALSLAAQTAVSGVLPEDRADVLYHYYDGGGVQIDGPSVLVRKKVMQDFSVYGNYYVDTVSSASIDVVTTASPYDEERIEKTIGVDYLRGDTLLSLAFTNSDEDDYTADTLNFGISQDVFGGLTTIRMSYGHGSDEVGRNGDDLFEDEAERRNYRLGISQVITRNMLLAIDYEAIADEGFLNNPYRSVRYLDPDNPAGFSYQPEVYPNTRASNAVAVRSRYFLPYRAALHGAYRFFSDDWEIDAHTAELGYTQPWHAYTFDIGYRFYTQTAADFYSDLFPYRDAQNFLARDKELSSFSSHTVRVGASYDFLEGGWRFLEKGSVNIYWDHIMFDYDNFRDLSGDGGVPGEEPTYSFEADVLQLFFSFWF